MPEMSSNNASSSRVRVGRFSFINVDPIYYGIEHEKLCDHIKLTSAPPAELNRLLAKGDLDISSVSSAAYALHHKEWLLLPGLSVACSGDVLSVLLVSRDPLEHLHGKKVLITNESATAAALTKLLFSYKGVVPDLSVAKILAPSHVGPDAAAALVIGDASLRYNWREEFEFVWDLGDLWAQHAGVPFVFAVWAVRKEYAEACPEAVARTIDILQESKRIGLSRLDDIVRNGAAKLNIDPGIARRYFENFSFDLNTSEQAGLKTFFHDLYTSGIFQNEARLQFFEH